MRTSLYESQHRLGRPRSELFPFFADAGNLGKITPPWLGFEILTPQPITMERGALIDYRLTLRFIPIRWRTEITAWDPPFRFVDEQITGPYRLWRHEHRFDEEDGATIMTDRVEYAVWGGAIVERLFVRRDIERIFTYRNHVLSDLFSDQLDELA